jgi:hypothetical protein
MEPGAEYLVLASYLPAEKLSSIGKIFKGASSVRKQLGTAEGLIGFSLRAKPLARKYWALAVWKDADALRTFVGSAPHGELMSSLKPHFGETRFEQWTVTAEDGPPTWKGALERLAAPQDGAR